MDKTLLDTDILSEVLKNRDEVVAERARTYLEKHRQLTEAVRAPAAVYSARR